MSASPPLLSTCTCLGALSACTSDAVSQAYGQVGRLLGLAFQVQDDILGIWGDPAVTGKSAASDLVSGKKSLPVLYGLQQAGGFARRWFQGGIGEAEAPGLAAQLEQEGGREYTQRKANELTGKALQALDAANPQGVAGQALRELAHQLLNRNM